MALLFGIQMAQAHNFISLMVESDCLDIVQATNSTSPELSELRFLVEALKLALHLASAAHLQHVKRTANTLPHLLAREAATHGFSNLFNFCCSSPLCGGSFNQ